MQKFFLFAVLTLFLASCSNVGKFKDSIETLSGDWDSTTSAIVALSEKVTTAQNSWNQAKAGMAITEEMQSTLGEDVLGQITELVAGNGAINEQFGGLSSGIFEFVANWEEKGKMLTALKDGLTAGKLPENPQASIDELTALIAEGKEKMGGWETALTGAQSAAQGALARFTELTSGAQ